ncbi:MAG: protein translocase subunit SecF, partial [bacterium]|nr:protein translocase subunit SecF [bacterium]
VQLKFNEAADIGKIRDSLKGIDLGDSVIQEFGSPEEVLVRVEKSSEGLKNLSDVITGALHGTFGTDAFSVERVEVVGPQVGQDLRRKALLALLYAMIGILIYITLRFELRFAVGANLALIHDVLITVGVFSVLNKEFNLPIIAAVLTIVGYSLNDTIVIFDRIRERLALKKKEVFETTVNESISQTLGRTLLTSLTTLLVVLALFFFGGEVIHDFAFALIIGVFVGTYSTVFIASASVVFLHNYQKPAKA